MTGSTLAKTRKKVNTIVSLKIIVHFYPIILVKYSNNSPPQGQCVVLDIYIP